MAFEKAVQGAQPVRSALARTTTDGVQGQYPIVQSHANEFVRGIGGIVAVLRWVVLGPVISNRGRVTGCAADDLGDQSTAEGR